MISQASEVRGDLKVSVIVCTYNPRPEFLQRTLNALAAQTLAPAAWELIIVDNHSAQPVAEAFPLPAHLQARHVYEGTLGLTAARMRGIAESRAELIVFVDDDNLLASDYLQIASRIDENWPTLAMWGGQQLPEFEIEPPPWLVQRQYLLALCAFTRDSWSNIAHKCPLPSGAGMCVRKWIAKKYVELLEKSPVRRSLGRTGASLASCEDTDLALMTCDLGHGTGQFEALKLTHLIPKERMTEDYIVKMTEMTVYSFEILLAIRGEWKPPTAPSVWQRINTYRYRQTLGPREQRFLDAERIAKEKARAFIVEHKLASP